MKWVRQTFTLQKGVPMLLRGLEEILIEANLMVLPVDIPNLSGELSHQLLLLEPKKMHDEKPWWGSQFSL